MFLNDRAAKLWTINNSVIGPTKKILTDWWCCSQALWHYSCKCIGDADTAMVRQKPLHPHFDIVCKSDPHRKNVHTCGHMYTTWRNHRRMWQKSVITPEQHDATRRNPTHNMLKRTINVVCCVRLCRVMLVTVCMHMVPTAHTISLDKCTNIRRIY